MEYDNVLRELYSIKEWKFKLGLANIKLLLKKLNNPEKNLRCIHVAGTNGKGSVCAMISSILSISGYKVGMYTSPHLKRFNERIRIDNKQITDKDVVGYYLKVKKHITNQSFFELTTAMMYLYFYEKKVDFVVLEVGMGGRLDSTNTIKPLISIITNIGYEHKRHLGRNLGKIAYEKSGIIKKNIPTVTGAEGIALKAIKKIANKYNSKLKIINNDNLKNKNYDKNNRIWSFDFNGYKNLRLNNLNGEFQIMNAAIAIKTLEILNKKNIIKINNINIKNGLKKVIWPGRFQFLEKNIIIDCAHNPAAFEIIFNELKNLNYNELIVIAGFSIGKDIGKISKIIMEKADKIILTRANNERAMKINDFKRYFENPIIKKIPKNALEYAKKISGKGDLILVAGSIYLIGEVI